MRTLLRPALILAESEIRTATIMQEEGMTEASLSLVNQVITRLNQIKASMLLMQRDEEE